MCSDLSPEETPVWLFQAVTKLDMLEKVPSGCPGQVDFHPGQVMGKGLRKSSSNQIIHKDKQEVAPSKQNVSLEFNFFSKPWVDLCRASDRVRQKMGNSAAFSREIMRQERSIMWQIMRFF